DRPEGEAGVLQGPGRGPLPGAQPLDSRSHAGRVVPERAADEGVDAARAEGARPQALHQRSRQRERAVGQGPARDQHLDLVPQALIVTPAVATRGLTKSYGPLLAVEPLDLELEAGAAWFRSHWVCPRRSSC